MATSNIRLHELGLSYPSLEDLPKPQHGWLIAKLVQYPAKDNLTGDVLPGQYTTPQWTTSFNTVITALGMTGEARRWVPGSTNNQPRYYWNPEPSDDVIMKQINDGHLFLYFQIQGDDIKQVLSVEQYNEYVAQGVPQAQTTPQPVASSTPVAQPTA